MTFTPDQYSQIAQGYDRAAADPLGEPAKRAEFAKKAEWFHFLARRGRPPEVQRACGNLTDEITGSKSRAIVAENPSEQPRGSMAPFLTTLWITGAGLYLIGTLLFTNAVNLFGNEERQHPVTEASPSVEPLPKVASIEGNKSPEQSGRQSMLANRRHAISPSQPSYESPALTAPSPPLAAEEPSSPPPSEPIQDAEVQSTEMLTVTAAAIIRNAPSTAGKKIGAATVGAELQVKAREKDWVQFVDPSSGNIGWIQSSLVAPAGDLTAPQAVTTAEAPKPGRQLPSAPVQVTKSKKIYVELSADEGFLPPRRRDRGFLREGLMSPGFLPPR